MALATLASGAVGRAARIGADPADDDELRQRKALLVLVSILILPISLVWGTLYLLFASLAGLTAFMYFVISVGSLLVFARTRSFPFLLNVQMAAILVAPNVGGQLLVGGFAASGAVGLWGIMAPLGALVFLPVRKAIPWCVAFLVVFAASGLIGELFIPDGPLPGWFTTTMLALNVLVTAGVVFTLLGLFASQRNAALSALQTEQNRSEGLLLNILPGPIAQRLKGRLQTIADYFPSASILFADVADFTPLAERLEPDEVVGILDRLFGRFDALVEEHGLEKIKTIGDCYMVAAGVPNPRPDHARAAALLALDMRYVTATASKALGQSGLELRIGINSGPVVAGVIGMKRFQYDLWGDAVNTASRMETQGEPGKIQITRATYEQLNGEFVCRPRGSVSIKGKGEMQTWYLDGVRTPDAVGARVEANA
jgi:guanylate cyclase